MPAHVRRRHTADRWAVRGRRKRRFTGQCPDDGCVRHIAIGDGSLEIVHGRSGRTNEHDLRRPRFVAFHCLEQGDVAEGVLAGALMEQAQDFLGPDPVALVPHEVEEAEQDQGRCPVARWQRPVSAGFAPYEQPLPVVRCVEVTPARRVMKARFQGLHEQDGAIEVSPVPDSFEEVQKTRGEEHVIVEEGILFRLALVPYPVQAIPLAESLPKELGSLGGRLDVSCLTEDAARLCECPEHQPVPAGKDLLVA